MSVGRMGWGREFKGRQVAFQSYVVQPDFLRVMGIPITDGRDFLESDFDKELRNDDFQRSGAAGI